MVIIFIGAILIWRCRISNGRIKGLNCKDDIAEEKRVFLDRSSKPVEMEEENEGIIHKWKSSSKDKSIAKRMKWNAKESKLSKAVDKDGRTVLHHACLTGNTSLVKSLLDIFTDLLYIKDNDGCAPFHLAGFSGSVELVQVLIGEGCNVRSKDNTGKTIVHHAFQAGHINLVKYLIDLEKDNNSMTLLQCIDKEGETIVHNACKSGHLNLVIYFMEIEKDVFDIKNIHGLTPFHCAGLSGSIELVQYLIDNGCDMYSKDNAGRTIVHYACQKGHVSLIKHLMGKNKNVINIKDSNGVIPFHCAGLSGSVELVQYLIDNGCYVNSKDNDGRTIAHIACKEGHVNLVKYLIDIEKGVLNKEEKNGLTPFHFAGFSGSVELVQYLIDAGCDVYSNDDIGRTSVHFACQKGHINLVKNMADKDKGVLKIKENNGLTPFHFAGFSGSVELVQYLIDNGCDVYSKNYIGMTIVHIACQEGHLNLVKYLADKDKGVLKIKMSNGLTPFHFAGFSGSVELAQYLIDAGCDVYSKDDIGRTIVHIACQKGHVNLVKNIADKDKGVLKIEENNGLIPFHFAGFSGSVELVQYLIDNSCDMYMFDHCTYCMSEREFQPGETSIKQR